MDYDHRVHAGNAGDVWKHFILAEAAEFLLAKRNKLIYAESHVGYPEYLLEQDGEWQEGIGRCWERQDDLLDFSYFKIIESMNSSALKKYPGSARIVMEVAKNSGSILDADVWDIDWKVATAWHNVPKPKFGRLRFHLGDGYAGVRSMIDANECALLLLDPPYLDRRDSIEAIDILDSAERRGWTVLWWQMMDIGKTHDMCCKFKQYPLEFAKVGLSCGKWKGANITLSGDDDLQNYVKEQSEKFQELMRSPELI
jgi:23S rRNA (adenine2030-N6)-methyltransferase